MFSNPFSRSVEARIGKRHWKVRLLDTGMTLKHGGELVKTLVPLLNKKKESGEGLVGGEVATEGVGEKHFHVLLNDMLVGALVDGSPFDSDNDFDNFDEIVVVMEWLISVNFGNYLSRFHGEEMYHPKERDKTRGKGIRTATEQREKGKFLDTADNIIGLVYKSNIIKESLEELYSMPFDGFCILYEMAMVDRDSTVEMRNLNRPVKH
ncbi:hypothetical protein CGK32_22765 [Vibrio parahaemolyticus]|uniref:phage tail assembly chaperone n=1 Tax=Vibrio parahaemolyticus TaxID=670 RepID=UPI00111E3EA2|nr:hypothetical protein [Vibrio parahaemolyticus]TOA18439.1 hypothetical protein CGK32_22765 [Vibrio parahaemolyticus]